MLPAAMLFGTRARTAENLKAESLADVDAVKVRGLLM
jgi:hypothetical protein